MDGQGYNHRSPVPLIDAELARAWWADDRTVVKLLSLDHWMIEAAGQGCGL